MTSPTDPAAVAADAQRRLWGRVLAATMRLARDIDIAEDATADAFMLALRAWPDHGVPDSVEAWLLTAARRRAIDRVRRVARLRERMDRLAAQAVLVHEAADAGVDAPPVDDDELRLVVLCCHPALAPEAQVALTMRLACGVPTAAVAAAFLVPTATMAARLTRAKQRIADSGTGIDLPDDVAVEERMPAVRRTVHLAYSMGHTAGAGRDLRNDDLAAHAERLARSLHELRPDDPECAGLLALVLLGQARAASRFDATGAQVLLEDADRGAWDRARMAEGLTVVDTIRSTDPGPLALQAEIAAEHVTARSFAATDWARIVALHEALLRIEPSPTIAVGRCVALSYQCGAGAGLADLDEVLALGGLERWPYAHAARAQLLHRLDRHDEAAAAWRQAAGCARTEAERTWFTDRAASSASHRLPAGGAPGAPGR